MRTYLAATIATGLVPLAGAAQEVGDPIAGLAYAHANCAECHALRDNKSPSPSAPAFADVAKTPGMTGRALAVWLQTSHPTMPNLIIAPNDRDNVAAYIMSLLPPPAL